jgi:hypothetical protein
VAQWGFNMKKLINPKNVLIGVLMFLILIMSFLYNGEIEKQKTEVTKTEMLLEAITDKMDSVVVENGNLMYSKKTLQANIKDLKSLEQSLTQEQKTLLTKVEKANKDKKLIAAALVKTKAELEAIKGKTNFKDDTTLVLSMASDSLSYEIEVTGVALASDSAQHEIVKLTIPNEMYIDFKWGTKKEGYPVSLSVTNSSPFMKTSNIESYIIPEISKEEIRPSGLQKIGNFIGNNKTPFAIGFAAGVASILILTK